MRKPLCKERATPSSKRSSWKTLQQVLGANTAGTHLVGHVPATRARLPWRPRQSHFFRGAHTVVECFFEQREPGKIRMREVHTTIRLRRTTAIGSPDESGRRPHHGVPPAPHVDTFHQRLEPDVRA